jgi:GMP synthase-like glutamine amidotransferase
VVGWWRIEAPDDKKSVIASSEPIGVQAFSSGRVLGLIAHPEYNRAFMQEFVTAMYFKLGKISPYLYEEAYYQS